MTNGPSSVPRLYWPQLDGLRFFAALLVFIHHADDLPGVPYFVKTWGWVGVNLFLVLSAFLLTRLLRAEVEGSRGPDLAHYFFRRICRIWPLHWTYVSVMLLLSILTASADPRHAVLEWFSHIGFFNNFVVAVRGYGTSLPHTSHLWTISLEEQYYLLVPFAVPALVRLRGANLARGIIGGALLLLWVARSVCVLLETPHPFIWTLPVRMDAMLLGTALGLGILDGERLREHAGLCFAAGLGLLLAATRFPPIEYVGWSQVPIYTVVDTACVLLVIGSLHGRVIKTFLSLRWLRYLGKVSFGIYVYHLVILHLVESLLRSVGIVDAWALFLTALPATCLVASLSYELLEKRFLRLKQRFTVVESRPL